MTPLIDNDKIKQFIQYFQQIETKLADERSVSNLEKNFALQKSEICFSDNQIELL